MGSSREVRPTSASKALPRKHFSNEGQEGSVDIGGLGIDLSCSFLYYI
jgi:hypothetical protein